MRTTTLAAIAAAGLLLTGCLGDHRGDPPAAETAPSTVIDLPPVTVPGETTLDPRCADPTYSVEHAETCGDAPVTREVPVEQGASWPTGMEARIVKITTEADPALDPAGDTMLHVTWELTNTGDTILALGGDAFDPVLYTGPNRQEAVGYFPKVPPSIYDLPEQITPGSVVAANTDHAVWADQLGELRIEAEMHGETVVLTGVERLVP